MTNLCAFTVSIIYSFISYCSSVLIFFYEKKRQEGKRQREKEHEKKM